MNKMKKLKQFEKQEELELKDYLAQPCEIDEEMYNHIICGYVPPSYSDANLYQAGEAEREERGVYYYMTVSKSNNKYWYLGILPEFKEEF